MLYLMNECFRHLFSLKMCEAALGHYTQFVPKRTSMWRRQILKTSAEKLRLFDKRDAKGEKLEIVLLLKQENCSESWNKTHHYKKNTDFFVPAASFDHALLLRRNRSGPDSSAGEEPIWGLVPADLLHLSTF